MTTDAGAAITGGRTALGIELGSTRIKAVLIGPDHAPLAVGSHDWENQLVDRLWTYSLDAVWTGLQQSVAALADDVRRRHGVELTRVGALGVSAMMHGYLAFDADGALLTPFRTWRNTNTGRAAERLSAEFGCNIPHRWSVAHLYQAILDGEEHVGRLDHLTTLAGYVHWQLTGEKVLGIGDASGMFPIDGATGGYDATMLARFDQLAAEAGVELTLAELLPAIAVAGRPAGTLTEAGAALLDPTGRLRPGIPLCPPEGDAGTGMVATNSVAPRTGNVSAGTSHLRHGRARAGARPGAPRAGPGHHAGRRPGGDGALQQRGQRAGRLGRAVRRVRPGAGLRGRPVEGLRDPVHRRTGRCERLRRDARLQLPLRGADHRPRGGPAALPAVPGQPARA